MQEISNIKKYLIDHIFIFKIKSFRIYENYNILYKTIYSKSLPKEKFWVLK